MDRSSDTMRLAGPAGFLEAAARFASSRAGRGARARELHRTKRARRVRRQRRGAGP